MPGFLVLVSLHLQSLWTDPLASARRARWGPGVSQPALLGAPGLRFPWIAPWAHGFLSRGACGAAVPLRLVARGPAPAAGCRSGPLCGSSSSPAGALATLRVEPGDQPRGHLGGPLWLRTLCRSEPGLTSSRVGECRSPEGGTQAPVPCWRRGSTSAAHSALTWLPRAVPDFPDQALGHHA